MDVESGPPRGELRRQAVRGGRALQYRGCQPPLKGSHTPCRGEHCSPEESHVITKLPGRTKRPCTPPYGPTTNNRQPIYNTPPHTPTGRRGRRPLRPNINKPPTVKFWPRRGQCGGRRKSVKKNAALLHFLAFSLADLPFGVPRGERLAAHNERRQFATQTRSCGYSPRWGEHCSLPSFATLNCGPMLATPQSPEAGLPRFRK